MRQLLIALRYRYAILKRTYHVRKLQRINNKIAAKKQELLDLNIKDESS